MNHHRVLPLIVILAIGSLLLLLRLAQVQLQQHEVWAEEALGLTYSGYEIPYRRGSIKDTHGNVLARSKNINHVALLYRDFRREHYLGQLAHARSLLEARAVGLPEARANSERWARELLELTPSQLELYATGKAVRLGSIEYEPLAKPSVENRPRRAKDIAFYASYLLNLDTKTRGRLEKLSRGEGKQRSFLQLALEVQGSRSHELGPLPSNLEEVWNSVSERMARYDQRLIQLAELLPRDPEWVGLEEPVDSLLRQIETVRRKVENETASKLFSEATQFVAGRIDPATLIEYVDLDWIAKLLAWDAERLYSWASSARTRWQETWLKLYALPRLTAQLQLSKRQAGALPDDFLSSMAGIFREEDVVARALDEELTDWRRGQQPLLVLDGLEQLFDARLPAGFDLGAALLPFQNPELIVALKPGARDWSKCAAFWVQDPGRLEIETEDAQRGERIGEWLTSGRYQAGQKLKQATESLVLGWDRLLQIEIRRRLEALRAASDPRQLSPAGRLIMREDWRERAAERAEYFLKDYGRRPFSLLQGEPDYEVIYRLTRYEQDYPGFFAREAPKREYPVLEGDQTRIAPQIVGGISAIPLKRLVKQRRAAETLAVLKADPSKTPEEQEKLADLVDWVELENEVSGYEGVEAYWNEELSGRNGFREKHGLDSISEGRRESMLVRERKNGLDLTLTLDSNLQRAAQATLQNPWNGGDPEADQDWYAEPVGALVLVDKHGDLLAAVSEPDASSSDPEAQRIERQSHRERTFRAPSFQPPGSVFKPFVAAYALSELRFDGQTILECGINEKNHGGYKRVNCSSRWGHGPIPLHDALVHSCNAYFARLAETMSDADLRAVCSRFGFDQNSGIRSQAKQPSQRAGFFEDVGGITAPGRLAPGGLTAHQRMMVGNGLAEMVATPVQLARATLALATGELSDLRLVRRIGDEDLPYASRVSLGLREAALEEVRLALHGVASVGTALGALGPAVLGLDVATKTGSADLVGSGGDNSLKVRKHTWVIGWVPYEEPELVFVVFMHDTSRTSSHGAIYLAQQLLQQPAVLNWLGERGVDTFEARRLGQARR